MTLRWSHFAVADRDCIMTHIAKDNVPAALEIDEKIANAVDQLDLFPEAGRVGRVSGTRELVVPRTNYIVVYRMVDKSKDVLILRVIHGAQDWPFEKR